MSWPENCDCYTDVDGYWVLGPACAAAERELWHETIDKSREIAEYIRRNGDLPLPKVRKVRFVNVGGKMRMIEDVELPED